MKDKSRRLMLPGLFLVAAFMFLSGIDWGLPSRRVDGYLFGSHRPWTGKQILDLAGAWDDSADRGADIAMHLLQSREQPVVLNETDAQRAQIVRRFRLYSWQPDEMITFRSLSSMKPGRGDFDPRFYQYGGLWVYPIGAMLKAASMVGLVTLKSDLAFYLDYPEAFARFYIVARLYTAMWGLLGVGIVYAIGKEWTGNPRAGLVSALLYMFMPVVVNMAHEAKPHLPGAVLTLAAVLTAMRFAKTGKSRHWVLAGVLCGAAFGMVLTGILSFAVLPVMTLLRPIPWKKRFGITAGAAMIGLAVFVITNPYLPLNLLFHHSVVQSNVGNYGNFYRPRLTLAGFANAARLLCEGCSTLLAIAGLLSVLFLSTRTRSSPLGWLLAAPAILIAIQYVLLAHDQAAEYGRFALTLDIILAIAAARAIASVPRWSKSVAGALVLFTALAGLRYLVNFAISTSSVSSRVVAARTLVGLKLSANVLAISAEPAPYCLPPVDLFAWKIVLLPRGTQASQFHLGLSVVSVKTNDEDPDHPRFSAPISWANKPFEINRE